jgi:hypothetical protein
MTMFDFTDKKLYCLKKIELRLSRRINAASHDFIHEA